MASVCPFQKWSVKDRIWPLTCLRVRLTAGTHTHYPTALLHRRRGDSRAAETWDREQDGRCLAFFPALPLMLRPLKALTSSWCTHVDGHNTWTNVAAHRSRLLSQVEFHSMLSFACHPCAYAPIAKYHIIKIHYMAPDILLVWHCRWGLRSFSHHTTFRTPWLPFGGGCNHLRACSPSPWKLRRVGGVGCGEGEWADVSEAAVGYSTLTWVWRQNNGRKRVGCTTGPVCSLPLPFPG